jgi:hypothetical protein
VHWLAESDELLEELRILGGHDDDLAHDPTRPPPSSAGPAQHPGNRSTDRSQDPHRDR